MTEGPACFAEYLFRPADTRTRSGARPRMRRDRTD